MGSMDCYLDCRKFHGAMYCLRECTGKPNPPPTTMRGLINRATGCPYAHIHVRDAHLDLISRTQLTEFLKFDKTDLMRYIKEGRDCLLPETPVIVRYNGITTIMEIQDICLIPWIYQEDIYVLDHSKNWTKVNWVKPKNSDKDVVTRSQRGHLRLTEDHKVKSYGEYKTIGSLSKSQNIDQIPLDGIFKNNVEIDTELAWMWGLFYADGFSKHYEPSGTQSHKYWFEIVNTNRGFLERALNALIAEFGEVFEIQSFESDKVGNVRGNATLKQQQYKIRITSQGRERGRKSHGNKKFVLNMLPHLYSIGHNKKVPDFILHGTKEVKQAYLDGAYAGDGDKTVKNNRLILSSDVGSLGIQVLLEELGESYKIVPAGQGKDAWNIIYGFTRTKAIPQTTIERSEHSGTVYDINTEAGELVIGNNLCSNCDDYALRLQWMARDYFFKKGINVALCMIEGPISTGMHRLNGVVLKGNVFNVIEPQTDGVFPVKDYLIGPATLVDM